MISDKATVVDTMVLSYLMVDPLPPLAWRASRMREFSPTPGPSHDLGQRQASQKIEEKGLKGGDVAGMLRTCVRLDLLLMREVGRTRRCGRG